MPATADRTRRRARRIDRRLETARQRLRGYEPTTTDADAPAEFQRRLGEQAGLLRRDIADHLETFRALVRLTAGWRRRVFAREERYDERADRALRHLYAQWAAYGEGLAVRAGVYRGLGFVFSDELSQLAGLKVTATQVLVNWEPPAPSLAPSFRPVALSADAVDKLRQMFPGKA